MTGVSQTLNKDADMNANWRDIAEITHKGSESAAIAFPESVRMLMEASFDGYAVDFRRATRTY
jgi:hypothetical protein